jgi:hypothetical protein
MKPEAEVTGLIQRYASSAKHEAFGSRLNLRFKCGFVVERNYGQASLTFFYQ